MVVTMRPPPDANLMSSVGWLANSASVSAMYRSAEGSATSRPSKSSWILIVEIPSSSARRRINLRVVGSAFALQAVTALIVLRTDAGVAVIGGLASGVIALLDFSKVGITSVFGPMETNPFANTFVIAALPVIVFFAAIVSILYHLGIMQRLVRWVGGAIGWITGISRVEALGGAAKIFVGQSESPLVVRPYLAAL
jgi:CNT family concentrative nucleoside transporter